MHLDEDLEVIAWQVGDLVHREGQLYLKGPQGFISFYRIILLVIQNGRFHHFTQVLILKSM